MKNRFTKYLDKDSVVVVEATTKRAALDELAALASHKSGIDIGLVRELTWKREKMMTTGVGGGLAIPHVRVDGLTFPIIFCGVCKEPICDYGTQDNNPVKVILYLMAPTGNQEAYLELLGSISSRLRTPGVVDEIAENVSRPSQVLRVLKRKAQGGDDEGEV